jgi:hypothetical protein
MGLPLSHWPRSVVGLEGREPPDVWVGSENTFPRDGPCSALPETMTAKNNPN